MSCIACGKTWVTCRQTFNGGIFTGPPDQRAGRPVEFQ